MSVIGNNDFGTKVIQRKLANSKTLNRLFKKKTFLYISFFLDKIKISHLLRTFNWIGTSISASEKEYKSKMETQIKHVHFSGKHLITKTR